MFVCLYVCACYATQTDKASWLQIVLSYTLHLPANSLSSPHQHARSLKPPTSLLSSPPAFACSLHLRAETAQPRRRRRRRCNGEFYAGAHFKKMQLDVRKGNGVGVRQRGAGNEAQAA